MCLCGVYSDSRLFFIHLFSCYFYSEYTYMYFTNSQIVMIYCCVCMFLLVFILNESMVLCWTQNGRIFQLRVSDRSSIYVGAVALRTSVSGRESVSSVVAYSPAADGSSGADGQKTSASDKNSIDASEAAGSLRFCLFYHVFLLCVVIITWTWTCLFSFAHFNHIKYYTEKKRKIQR